MNIQGPFSLLAHHQNPHVILPSLIFRTQADQEFAAIIIATEQTEHTSVGLDNALGDDQT
jgi:hypothetical protein